MIYIDFCGLPHSAVITEDSSLDKIHQAVEKVTHLSRNYYYLLNRGLPIYDGDAKISGEICVVPRLLGGKGGFGSMLRAIGAQIEKTTNREACRDLSGRRLRDINEEQRLKTWIAQQSEREKEAEERKKRRLEKLAAEPKHEFSDEQYDQARSELSEKLYESVEKGLQASTSSKRPSDEDNKPKKKVKKFLKCEEEDLLSSSDESVEDKPSGSTSVSIANS